MYNVAFIEVIRRFNDKQANFEETSSFIGWSAFVAFWQA